MTYTLSIGGAPKPLGEYAIGSATLTLRANGFDTLDFAADSDLRLSAIAHGTEVRLYGGGACVFIGEITGLPGVVSKDSAPEVRYTATSYLARLDKLQYCQKNDARKPDGTESAFVEPSVILGRDMTNAAQIHDVLSYASAYAPVSPGASWPGGYDIRPDAKDNITCWDAIYTMLRWLPDHVLWCDYSTGSTVVRMAKKGGGMASVTVPLSGSAKEEFAATPRHDLQMVGVNVYFRWTSSYDGAAVETRSVQSAGDYASPLAEKFYVDLQGLSVSTVSQSITVAELPNFGLPQDFAVKAFLQMKAPLVSSMTSFYVEKVTRKGTKNYPNELIKGAVFSWMGCGIEQETVVFTVRYEVQDSDHNVIERATLDIPVHIQATDGITRKYTGISSMDSGESAPEGLADGIYSAWSSLHWDGSITAASLPGPGSVLNVSGSAPEFASIDAIVQELVIDLKTGVHSARFGTSRAIEADSYMALMRALRNHRFSYRLPPPKDDKPDDGIGILVTPSLASAASPPKERMAMSVVSGGKKVVIDPAAKLPSGETMEIKRVTIVTDVTEDDAKKQTLYVLSTTPEDVGGGGERPPPCGHPGNSPGGGAHPYDPSDDHPGNSPSPPCTPI
jgi:hypothetical protein